MVKKLKAMAESKSEGKQLAAAVRDSAQQIWLAGLGAFSKAQEEGGKVFEALVKEGLGIQRRTRAMTEEKIGEVTGKMSKAAGDITKQATHSWDKLEQVFEDRVSRALKRLGVPTSKDIQALMHRVETLNDNVQALSGATPVKTRKAPAARKAAAKAPARKAPRRKAAA
ncbi:MAG: phasin family protein [Burkholderiaceae bacterium]|nr:phasin family protein [Burkholderiaceae bacterium]